MFKIMPYGTGPFPPSTCCKLFSQCVLSFERQNGLNKVLLHDQIGKASFGSAIPNYHLPMTIKVILIQFMMPATVAGGNIYHY
jgi:hypothetical protein